MNYIVKHCRLLTESWLWIKWSKFRITFIHINAYPLNRFSKRNESRLACNDSYFDVGSHIGYFLLWYPSVCSSASFSHWRPVDVNRELNLDSQATMRAVPTWIDKVHDRDKVEQWWDFCCDLRHVMVCMWLCSLDVVSNGGYYVNQSNSSSLANTV